jgi:lysophospholipase L1-like esterase
MRVVLLANSQATAAGVAAGEHYPALLRDRLVPPHELHLLAMTGWSIREANLHFPTVRDVRPDLVLLQLGVVDAVRRILSSAEKRTLAALGPVGNRITGALHRRRPAVIRLRHRLGIDTRLVPPAEFERELDRLLESVRASGAEPVLFEIPPFGVEHERAYFPLVGDDVATYNAILRSRGAVPLLPPEADPDAIWQPGTVHFTARGHELVAARVAQLVEDAPARASGS